MKLKLYLLTLFAFMSICCHGTKVEVAENNNFDISKYLGTWHEIARLDHSFERGLDNVTAHYSLKENGKVAVLNKGFDSTKNKWKEATANAVQTKVKNYLKVYFVPLIGGNYRVAYVDDDYTFAVVSGGSLKYLWFLSRTPQVTEQQMSKMLEVARSMGYDTSKLIYPKQ